MTHIRPGKLYGSALALLFSGMLSGSLSAQDYGATPVVWVNGKNVSVSGNAAAGGSMRVASTTVTWGGQSSMRRPMPRCTSALSIRW